MKAIVHIGLPKAGTTTTQRWLAKNRNALSKRGITFDRINISNVRQPSSQAELLIAMVHQQGKLLTQKSLCQTYSISAMEDQAAIVEEFSTNLRKTLNKAPPGNTAVFSCEYLRPHARKPADVAALDTWLKGFFDDVTYLIYLRRQEDLLVSRYSQSLRRNATRAFAEFVEGNKVENYNATIRMWRKSVGRERLLVRLLEPDAMKGGDLIEDFADAIGTDAKDLPHPDRANERFSAAANEIFRLVNVQAVQRGSRFDRKWLRSFKSNLVELGKDLPSQQMTSDQIEEVRSCNAETNSRICKAYFPQRSELFPALPTSDCESDSLRAEDVSHLASQLLRVHDIMNPETRNLLEGLTQ